MVKYDNYSKGTFIHVTGSWSAVPSVHSLCLETSLEPARRVVNPYNPEFLKWTITSFNLDISIDANRGFSLKSKTEWQTV